MLIYVLAPQCWWWWRIVLVVKAAWKKIKNLTMKLGYRNDGVELDGNTVIIFHTSTRFSLAHFLFAHSLSVEMLKTRELKLCVYSTHRHSGCQADCCIVAWRMCDGDEEKVLNWLCVFLTWVRLRCCNKRDLSRKYTKKSSPLFLSSDLVLSLLHTNILDESFIYFRLAEWLQENIRLECTETIICFVHYYAQYTIIATNNIEIFGYLENFFLR